MELEPHDDVHRLDALGGVLPQGKTSDAIFPFSLGKWVTPTGIEPVLPT
jgi:hypothetical protein